MLLPCTLSLLLLSSHTLPFTSAQLLFPVNVPNADGAGQIPFHSTHEHQAGGAGALWQARENGRAPRVAIIGGGAAGELAVLFSVSCTFLNCSLTPLGSARLVGRLLSGSFRSTEGGGTGD